MNWMWRNVVVTDTHAYDTASMGRAATRWDWRLDVNALCSTLTTKASARVPSLSTPVLSQGVRHCWRTYNSDQATEIGQHPKWYVPSKESHSFIVICAVRGVWKCVYFRPPHGPLLSKNGNQDCPKLRNLSHARVFRLPAGFSGRKAIPKIL